MAKRQNDEPQSQSQPGGTSDNPNEDVADGNQSTIQPGLGTGNTEGGDTSGDPAPGATDGGDAGSEASTGGNPAAAPGGANSSSGGNQ